MCGGLVAQYADSCYGQVARSSGNAADCGAIVDADLMGACYVSIAESSMDYATCANAGEPYASGCEEKIALELQDRRLCSGISNSTYAIECSSIINTRIAAATLSSAPCINVTRSSDKPLTQTIIENLTDSGILGYHPSGVSALSTIPLLPNVTYTARDFCYTLVANISRNFSLCNLVSAGIAREICTSGSAASSNSTANYTQLIAGCSEEGTYAQQCIDSVRMTQAVKAMNASICGQLGTQSTVCYTLLASTYKNASYCNYISDTSQQSACVSGS
jgi:hypothetical protein